MSEPTEDTLGKVERIHTKARTVTGEVDAVRLRLNGLGELPDGTLFSPAKQAIEERLPKRVRVDDARPAASRSRRV